LKSISVSDLPMYQNCNVDTLVLIDEKNIKLDILIHKIYNVLKQGELYLSIDGKMQKKLLNEFFFIELLQKYGHHICFFSLQERKKNSNVGYVSFNLSDSFLNDKNFKKILYYQEFGFDVCYKINETVYLYVVEYANENYGYSEGIYIDNSLKTKIMNIEA